MPADTAHKSCPQPTNADLQIWRHMDFAKYVSMLRRRALYFASLQSLGDPHEGTIPRQEFEEIQRNIRSLEQSGKKIVGFHKGVTDFARRYLFANCWCGHEGESDALWRIYGTEGGVAIQTTYATLVSVLSAQDHVGLVRYIDYDTESIGDNNALSYAMHKRRAYAYEYEVRAMRLLRWPALNATDREKQEWLATTHVVSGDRIVGFHVPVDIERLIHRVIVSPQSADWFGEVVQETTKAFGVDLKVYDSVLRSEPLVDQHPVTEEHEKAFKDMMRKAKPVQHVSEITSHLIRRPASYLSDSPANSPLKQQCDVPPN